MKKVLSLILLLAMLSLGAFSVGASIVDERYADGVGVVVDNTFTLGDVTDDGKIDAKDVLSLKSRIAAIDKGLNFVKDAADIDANGDATSRDVFYIKGSFVDAVKLSDFNKAPAIENLTIAGNPISDYEIVYNDDFVAGADSASAAASYIMRYVRLATGVVLKDSIGTTSAPHMIRIVYLDQYAPSEERMGLDIEDYVYEVKNGDLYIYGTLRGCMFAVSEIAEKYLGYRFLTPRNNYVYKSRAVDIPEGTYERHETQLELRYSGQSAGGGINPSYFYASRLNGSTSGFIGEAFGYATGPVFDNAHTFLSYDRYYDAYTKMLFERGMTEDEVLADFWGCFTSGTYKDGHTWQPCASPTDDIHDELTALNYQEKSDYYRMFTAMLKIHDSMNRAWYPVEELIEKGVLRISFSICDNGNACSCRACSAKVRGTSITGRTEQQVKQYVNGYKGNYTYTYDPSATASKRYSITFEKEYISGLYLELTNRAARDVQEYYPDMTVWTIIYAHNKPASIRPSEHTSIMYCGHGCIQHALGTHGCGTDKTVLNTSNVEDEEMLKWWAEECHKVGSKIWFWTYYTNYGFLFLSTPDIFDLYTNYNYILNYCDFDGIYYEGQGFRFNFELLKSYLSNQLLWNQNMSYDDFIKTMKEYLYLYYGDGYEEIYQYIVMQQAAGDAVEHCFITNHDRPFDMYSWQYLDEHYEEMRALLETAYEKAETADSKEEIQHLIYTCDFMGLSSAYVRLYKNGTAEQRQMYVDRAEDLRNYIEYNGYSIEGDDVYVVPEEIDYSTSLVYQFYDMPAWRATLNPPV